LALCNGGLEGHRTAGRPPGRSPGSRPCAAKRCSRAQITLSTIHGRCWFAGRGGPSGGGRGPRRGTTAILRRTGAAGEHRLDVSAARVGGTNRALATAAPRDLAAANSSRSRVDGRSPSGSSRNSSGPGAAAWSSDCRPGFVVPCSSGLSGLSGSEGSSDCRQRLFLSYLREPFSGGCCGGSGGCSAAAGLGAAGGGSTVCSGSGGGSCRARGAITSRTATAGPSASTRSRRTGPHGPRPTRTALELEAVVLPTPPRQGLLHQIDDLLSGQSPHRGATGGPGSKGWVARASCFLCQGRGRLRWSCRGRGRRLVTPPLIHRQQLVGGEREQWRSDRAVIAHRPLFGVVSVANSARVAAGVERLGLPLDPVSRHCPTAASSQVGDAVVEQVEPHRRRGQRDGCSASRPVLEHRGAGCAREAVTSTEPTSRSYGDAQGAPGWNGAADHPVGNRAVGSRRWGSPHRFGECGAATPAHPSRRGRSGSNIGGDGRLRPERARRSAQQGMQATRPTPSLPLPRPPANHNAAQAGSTAASSSANFKVHVAGDRRQRKGGAPARWRPRLRGCCSADNHGAEGGKDVNSVWRESLPRAQVQACASRSATSPLILEIFRAIKAAEFV